MSDAPSRKPVIVLVRPQLGENIGKAARAMLNFGLTEMRLVSPRDGWPNPSAGPAAAGADVVLEKALVFETLAEAVADCSHVYATTVRKRGVTKPVLTPEQAAKDIVAAPGRSALVFGPERSGLETDDVALARAIVTAPINPEFGSLNLAQAVAINAYEWRQTVLDQPPAVFREGPPPADQAQITGLFEHLEDELETAGFFHPPEKKPAMVRNLRVALGRARLTDQEARTFRGVITALSKGRGRVLAKLAAKGRGAEEE